ncbi:hypothetical protein ACFVRU_47755 [Streptomyces sp. NPDC057927]
MDEMIKLERLRKAPYFVNYKTQQGNNKTYNWSGVRGKQRSITSVPREVYDWLTLESYCFRNGELVVAKDEPKKAEVEEFISDVEEYKNNSHSEDEIKKLLTGNINKMKSELNKITSDTEKRFVFDVMDEIKGELSNGKTDFIKQWVKEKPFRED